MTEHYLQAAPELPLRKGSQLSAGPSGPHYRLEGYLGGGRTAEVWKAESLQEPGRQFALKIMAPGLDRALHKQFLDEVLVLRRLEQAERSAGLRVEGVSLLPQVEVVAEYHSPPFFVETLATGKPLDEIMRDGLWLAEADVIVIGEQLCRLFGLLHTALQRSYLDFQPRNVFWDEQARRILVIDWNLLSAEGRADIRTDLETLARLIYRLAVGEAPRPGYLDSAAGWAHVSTGMQAFLGQALNPNPARRYTSAEEMRASLQQLLDWWCEPWDTLLSVAASGLEQVRAGLLAAAARRESGRSDSASAGLSPAIERRLHAALAILDIAERKGAEPLVVHKMREQAREWLRETLAQAQGRALFSAGDYGNAVSLFQQARDDATTIVQSLAAWRWTLAAGAGHACPALVSPQRRAITTLVERLTHLTAREAQPEAALDPAGVGAIALAPLDGPRAPPELRQLVAEAEAWEALLRARAIEEENADAYQARAAAYGQALDLVAQLPYGPDLLSLWGDLAALRDQSAERAQTLRERDTRYEDLCHSFETVPSDAIKALAAALEKEPHDADLSELALNWARRLLTSGEASTAKELLHKTLKTLNTSALGPSADLLRQAARQLRYLHTLEWIEEQTPELGASPQGGPDSLTLVAALHELADGEATPFRGRAWTLALRLAATIPAQDQCEEPLALLARRLAPDEAACAGFETLRQARRREIEQAAPAQPAEGASPPQAERRATPEEEGAAPGSPSEGTSVTATTEEPAGRADDGAMGRLLPDRRVEPAAGANEPSGTTAPPAVGGAEETAPPTVASAVSRAAEQSAPPGSQAPGEQRAGALLSELAPGSRAVVQNQSNRWETQSGQQGQGTGQPAPSASRPVDPGAAPPGGPLPGAAHSAPLSAQGAVLRPEDGLTAVHAHQEEARRLIRRGTVQGLEEALGVYREALRLARELCESHPNSPGVATTLQEIRDEFHPLYNRGRAVRQAPVNLKRLQAQQRWAEAGTLIERLINHFGIGGIEEPGDLARLARRVHFEKEATTFKRAYAGLQQETHLETRRGLHEQMLNTLDMLRRLRPFGDAVLEQRLNQMEQDYQDYWQHQKGEIRQGGER